VDIKLHIFLISALVGGEGSAYWVTTVIVQIVGFGMTDCEFIAVFTGIT
jgi:hypothetical protein